MTGETFPTQRLLDDEAEGTEMEGVEHLGQYVYEMTQAKVASLKAESGKQDVMEAVVEAPAEDLTMGEAEDDEFDHNDDLEELEDVEDVL